MKSSHLPRTLMNTTAVSENRESGRHGKSGDRQPMNTIVSMEVDDTMGKSHQSEMAEKESWRLMT